MTKSPRRTLAVLISAAALLAGCNGATQALDTATPAPTAVQPNQANADQTAQDKAAPDKLGKDGTAQDKMTAKADAGQKAGQMAAADATPKASATAEGAKIIHEPSTVTQKGNYIRVVVNNEPITNYDVQRRIKFRQVRRLKATAAEAIKELIDEKLKLQEARRRHTLASDAQVDQAFANFAKSNHATPQKIAQDLDRIGVGAQHFKNFVRAQISWNRTVGSKLQAETRSTSQNEALFEIRKSGSAKPETKEYTLQQIVFVIPAEKRKELLAARKAEATAFAQRFSGCDSSIDMAKGLHDVFVKDLTHVLEPELPRQWAKEVQDTEIGKTTKPQESPLGVELFAVCKVRVVADDRAAQVVTQSQEFSSLEHKGGAEANAMLAKLRNSAVIIYK